MISFPEERKEEEGKKSAGVPVSGVGRTGTNTEWSEKEKSKVVSSAHQRGGNSAAH